jgi:hypothetical protein
VAKIISKDLVAPSSCAFKERKNFLIGEAVNAKNKLRYLDWVQPP